MFKCNLIGRLGNDIKINQNQYGQSGFISIAVDKSYKDKDGKKVSKVMWVSCVINNENYVKAIAKYLTKGTQVYIDGEPYESQYTDQNGVINKNFIVRVNDLKILSSSQQQEQNQPYQQSHFDNENNNDDEIPF